jgi:hypothetical protein
MSSTWLLRVVAVVVANCHPTQAQAAAALADTAVL